MLNPLYGAMPFVASVIISALVITALGVTVAFITGRRNRTVKDKVAHQFEKTKGGVFARIASTASKCKLDDVALHTFEKTANSYLNSFQRDVKRGCKILSPTLFQNDSRKKNKMTPNR